MTKTVIGIGFGTVYSCISIPGENGLAAEAIANEDGHRQIPSYVAFTALEQLAGTQAKQQALSNPSGTITHFRQLLGRDFHHATVQKHVEQMKTKITKSSDGTVVYETEYYEEDAEEPTTVSHSVIQVTAEYLKKLKSTAEYFLSKTVDGCVISIPAHFEEVQKKALLKAAHEAGFSSAYSLHEPVAAVMAFEKSVLADKVAQKNDKLIAVLDLGAEAFNVSVVSSHDGLYTIEKSIEQTNLGGNNFDKVLVDHISQDFQRKTKLDISESKRSLQKLSIACETVKRALTRQDTAPVQIEALHEGVDYNGSIMRGRFEMLADGLYSRCKQTVLSALQQAGVTAAEIDQVIVIGGASRMPRFLNEMKSLFPNIGNEFRTEVEPDEAISLGCAVQATILAEAEHDLDEEFDPKVIDAAHLSKAIGITSKDGQFISVIPAGTPIPVRREISVKLEPKQTDVYLAVSEKGQKQTILLAEVALTNLAADIENGVVEVVFLIEDDKSLCITMTEKKSGEKVSALIK